MQLSSAAHQPRSQIGHGNLFIFSAQHLSPTVVVPIVVITHSIHFLATCQETLNS